MQYRSRGKTEGGAIPPYSPNQLLTKYLKIMRFIPATENDYNRATRQTATGRNGRTTSGAKFVSNEKHGEKAKNTAQLSAKEAPVMDYRLAYSTK